MIFLKNENNILTRVFVEIKKTKKKTIEDAKIICMPQSDYLCSFYPDECVKEATDKYLQHSSFNNGNILIVSDVLDKKIGNKTMHLEVQLVREE